MKYVNLAMTCCTKKTCKRRIISEVVTRKCPICGSIARKEKKFVAKALDKDTGYIILKEKGNKLNDSNKRATTKSKKRKLPGQPYRASRINL